MAPKSKTDKKSPTYSYRGIAFAITKGPNTKDNWSTRPYWHAVISFVGGSEQVLNKSTQSELIEHVERAINIHLDYDGDHEVYWAVEQLVRTVTSRWLCCGKHPTVFELRGVISRICERATRIVETRYAATDRAELANKLRAMTVASGCTPEEAATAAEKLRHLEGRP